MVVSHMMAIVFKHKANHLVLRCLVTQVLIQDFSKIVNGMLQSSLLHNLHVISNYLLVDCTAKVIYLLRSTKSKQDRIW